MTASRSHLVHATVVTRRVRDGWRGVMLTGPSGAGKSDLALRLIGQGRNWRLVADDYCHVWRSGDALWAEPPQTIAGRIEARSLGIVSAPFRPMTRLWLAVACGREPVERMPAPASHTVAGLALPLIRLDIRPASAVDLVEMALEQL